MFLKRSPKLDDKLDPNPSRNISIIFKKTKVFSKELNDKFSKIKEDFCFLFVGHWLQGDLGNDRKDLGMLVKTFFNR